MAGKDHTFRNVVIGIGVGFAAAYLMKKENRDKLVQSTKDAVDIVMDKVEEVKNDPGIVGDMVKDRVEQISEMIEDISEDIDTFRKKLD
ncbi:MAG: hypothetical protein ACI35O_14660 [Bacillaceae bacterium]